MTPYVPNDVGPGHRQGLRAYSIMDSKTEYTYLHQIDRNLEATQNHTGTVYSEDPIMKFTARGPGFNPRHLHQKKKKKKKKRVHLQ